MKSKKLAQLLKHKKKQADDIKPKQNVFLARDIEVPDPENYAVEPETDTVLFNTSASRIWINTRRNLTP